MSNQIARLKQVVAESKEALKGLEGADLMRAMLNYNIAKNEHRLAVRAVENNSVSLPRGTNRRR